MKYVYGVKCREVTPIGTIVYVIESRTYESRAQAEEEMKIHASFGVAVLGVVEVPDDYKPFNVSDPRKIIMIKDSPAFPAPHAL